MLKQSQVSSTVVKYLQHYAQCNTHLLSQFLPLLSRDIRHTVVIPAFNESADFLRRLSAHPDAESTLLILVINQPVGVAASHENQELFAFATQNIVHQQENITLTRIGPLQVLVMDCFNHNRGLPAKQGVGLARKLGADIACALYALNALTSSWIYSTDADTHLPKNYFTRSVDSDSFGAMVFSFTHLDNNNPISAATQLYEQAIKYYAKGLAWAGSPYGFCTLGSALAFQIEAYAQVRGFPKKSGGEDFYLLNKIAKVAKVTTITDIALVLDARQSARVPFGTGPSTTAILQAPLENYCYYHPQIFYRIKRLITWAENHLCPKHALPADALAKWQAAAKSNLPTSTMAALEALGFEKFIEHARCQCANQDAVRRHFHIWFDAFKTLKFVHFLQANRFSATPITQCLRAMELWHSGAIAPTQKHTNMHGH